MPPVSTQNTKLGCSDVEITDLLFGNDLIKGIANTVTAIDSASKLGMDFTQSNRGGKLFPPWSGKKKRGVEREGPWARQGWHRGRQRRGRGYHKRQGAWQQRPTHHSQA